MRGDHPPGQAVLLLSRLWILPVRLSIAGQAVLGADPDPRPVGLDGEDVVVGQAVLHGELLPLGVDVGQIFGDAAAGGGRRRRPVAAATEQERRDRESHSTAYLVASKSLQILDQIVELVLGHVVGDAVLVVGVVAGPDLLQRVGDAVVQVGRRVVDVVQVRHVELALAIVGLLGARRRARWRSV